MYSWEQHTEEQAWRTHRGLEEAFAGLALRPEDAAKPTMHVMLPKPATAAEKAQMAEERAARERAEALERAAEEMVTRQDSTVIYWLSGEGIERRAEAFRRAAKAYDAWAVEMVDCALHGHAQAAPVRDWHDLINAAQTTHATREATLAAIEAEGWATYAAWRRWVVEGILREKNTDGWQLRSQLRAHVASGVTQAEYAYLRRRVAEVFDRSPYAREWLDEAAPELIQPAKNARGWWGLHPLHLDPPPTSWLDKTTLD